MKEDEGISQRAYEKGRWTWRTVLELTMEVGASWVEGVKRGKIGTTVKKKV